MRASLVFSTLLVAGAAVSPTAQQRFHSGVEAVRVDVSVTRNGKPVAGLVAADFEVRDSGVRQRVEVFSVEEMPVNLDLILDTSVSTRGEHLQDLKQAAKAALTSLRRQDTVALIIFSHVLRRPLSSSIPNLIAAIDNLEPAGATALADAVFCAIAMRSHDEGRTLAILFTDGFDTASWLSPMTVIEQARRSEVVFNAAVSGETGVADEISRVTGRPVLPAERRRWFLSEPELFREGFVSVLVDETGGTMISVPRGGDLRTAFLDLLSEFRSRYTLVYSPENVSATGWHPIEARVKGAIVRARRGYVR
jgi:VWFA-related protein